MFCGLHWEAQPVGVDQLGEVPCGRNSPKVLLGLVLGGSHTGGESGVLVGVPGLSLGVKAAEMHFSIQNNSGFGDVSPGPGADQVALQ